MLDKRLAIVGENGPTLFGTGVGTVITIHAAGCEVRGSDDRRERRGRDQRHGRGRADHVERQPHRRQSPPARLLRHRRRERDRQRDRGQRDRRPGRTRRSGGAATASISTARRRTSSRATRSRDERDGIYFQYAPRGRAIDNVVTDSRYGLHDMFSDDTRIAGNTFSGLVGRRQHHELAPDHARRQPLRAQPRRRRRRADAQGQRQFDRSAATSSRTIRAACCSTDRRRIGSPTTCSAPTTRPSRCLRAPSENVFSGNQFRDNWSDLVLSGAARRRAGRPAGGATTGAGTADSTSTATASATRRTRSSARSSSSRATTRRRASFCRARRPRGSSSPPGSATSPSRRPWTRGPWSRRPASRPTGGARDTHPAARGPDGGARSPGWRSFCSGRRDHAHARRGDQVVRRTPGARPSRSLDRRGRERRPDRRERLGQDHDAALRGRPRAARRGADHD